MSETKHLLQITFRGTTYQGELPGPPWLCALVVLSWLAIPFFVAGSPAPIQQVVRAASPAPAPEPPSGPPGEEIPRDEPYRRPALQQARLGVSSDVKMALEGVDSGLVYLESEEERALFDYWKSLVRFSKHDGSFTLFWDGEESYDGVRTYLVSLDGVKILGRMKLQKFGNRWYVVGVASPESEAREAAERRRAHKAFRMRLEEREE